MDDPADIEIKTTLFGMDMQSPFVVGSSPLTFCADAMIEAHHYGAGAVVTKTIRDTAAVNPIPHIYSDGTSRSLINAELWSDLSASQWIAEEIPKAVKAGVNVVASVGHSAKEAEHLVPLVDEAGACVIELVSYDEEAMIPMVREAVKRTHKPIVAKLSPNWPDPLAIVSPLIDAGVSGFTAMDSVGPVLRIDIRTKGPVVGSPDGRGWLSGTAIKSIVLHYVQKIASSTSLPVIGLGGVRSAEDAVEFSMAGASAIGLCTALMLHGISYLSSLLTNTKRLLKQLGYCSFAQTRSVYEEPKQATKEDASFHFDAEACNDCGRCRIVCSYKAQHTQKASLDVDMDSCRLCGLCVSVCPTHALSFHLR